MSTNLNQTVQVMANGVVNVMVVNLMTTAIGVMMASMGTEMIPSGLPATDRAIEDMRWTFGHEIVNQAVKNVGKDDILKLAEEVERLTIEDMVNKYGETNTRYALDNAYPGDLRAARAIAHSLSNSMVAPTSSPEKVEKAQATAKRRGRQTAQPQKDTKTGIIYNSKAAAGMAVAEEYGLSPTKPDGKPNSFVWYEVIKKDPKRFVSTS